MIKYFFLLTLILNLSSAFASGNKKTKMQGNCSGYEIDVSREIILLKTSSLKVSSESKNEFKFKSRLDEKIQLNLTPKNKIKLSHPPEKVFHPGEKSYAGLLSFKVQQNGTYRITGDGKFWFDLIDSEKGELVKSEKFSMQTNCQGVFKVVSFRLLKNKPYILQVTSSLRPAVQLLLTIEN
jgi:hypothetical protein